MRTTLCLCGVLLGMVAQAWAADPTGQAQPVTETSTSPESSNASSATSSAAPTRTTQETSTSTQPPEGSAPASSSRTTRGPADDMKLPPAAAPNATNSDKDQLTREEKSLLAAGYKMRVVKGERIFCHEDSQLGSRLMTTKRCGTARELSLTQRSQQNDVSKTQRVGNLRSN